MGEVIQFTKYKKERDKKLENKRVAEIVFNAILQIQKVDTELTELGIDINETDWYCTVGSSWSNDTYPAYIQVEDDSILLEWGHLRKRYFHTSIARIIYLVESAVQ